MSTAGWGITRKGDLTLFNRDPPSCFSNRVARVRRSNSLEDRRLEEKIRTIHLEHSIRKGQLYNEKKTLVNQLSGIQRVRETPEVGLQRRKLQQAKASNQVVFHKAGRAANSIPLLAQSASSSSLQGHLSSHVTTPNVTSSVVTSYPSVDCRCCYTGYRLRRGSTMATSPDYSRTRSPAFPSFSSSNERESLSFLSRDEACTYSIPNGFAVDYRQSGLNSWRLPTLEDNR